MSISNIFTRIGFIVLLQQLVAIFKQNYQRWVIRTHLSEGELSIMKMLSTEFLSTLTVYQVVWLGSIALFTLATFPLGVWLGSFDIGASYPIMNIIGASINLLTFPVALYTMSHVLGELELNQSTWTGIALIIVSKLIIILGCWYMYIGNNGGQT